ncbi:hypothetical protein ABW19_dt0202822 [Dactylella cylindrospora]|nr:hypothetical protein ABW19_dt0202822 [Dactylella cylindrospora]
MLSTWFALRPIFRRIGEIKDSQSKGFTSQPIVRIRSDEVFENPRSHKITFNRRINAGQLMSKIWPITRAPGAKAVRGYSLLLGVDHQVEGRFRRCASHYR